MRLASEPMAEAMNWLRRYERFWSARLDRLAAYAEAEEAKAGRREDPGEHTMTSLTLVRRIAARPSIVFDALTTPDGIACWWGPDDGPVLLAETDVRVGGRFRVRFRMLDGTEHESSGQYIEVVKPTRLVMSWRWTHGGEPEEAGEESRVEIDLRRDRYRNRAHLHAFTSADGGVAGQPRAGLERRARQAGTAFHRRTGRETQARIVG